MSPASSSSQSPTRAPGASANSSALDVEIHTIWWPRPVAAAASDRSSSSSPISPISIPCFSTCYRLFLSCGAFSRSLGNARLTKPPHAWAVSVSRYHRNLYMNELFRHFAKKSADVLGTVWAFLIAVVVILVWLITGPMFGFSDTWQMIINTATTIVTFLMVFLIQNTQNRDARALHLKLDELLRAVGEARTGLVDLEDLTDEELEKLQCQFQELRKQHLEDSTLEMEDVEVKAEYAERTAKHAEEKADEAENVAEGAARAVTPKKR